MDIPETVVNVLQTDDCQYRLIPIEGPTSHYFVSITNLKKNEYLCKFFTSNTQKYKIEFYNSIKDKTPIKLPFIKYDDYDEYTNPSFIFPVDKTIVVSISAFYFEMRINSKTGNVEIGEINNYS